MLNADYLVIGAGAVGLAFVDEILSHSDATAIVVDRRSAVGGHWLDAYPFVRLHQPSAYYGVGSRRLGANRIDAGGLNAGLYELSTGQDVRAYFQALLDERFLPSGRVTFLPGMEHLGSGRLRETGSGLDVKVRARKLVDATWFNTTIPKLHRRTFAVEEGVRVIPPNDLPDQDLSRGRIVVLGGGKTGMDAAAWLLGQGVDPEGIVWVIPQAMWVINRAFIQPGAILDYQTRQIEAAAAAISVDDLFDRLEASGVHLRLHADVRPSAFRGATIAPAEARQLSAIRQVIRLGRVRRISNSRIELERGDAPARPDDLYVDCTASALQPGPPVRVFDGDRIVVQMIRPGLTCLSAAVIGKVETMGLEPEAANELCRPIQVDRTASGFPANLRKGLETAQRWSRNRELRTWLSGHRLTGADLPGASPQEVAALRARSEAARDRAMDNLVRLAA